MGEDLKRLLIIACSATKIDSEAPTLAAVDLYDGPMYRMLRKMERDYYVNFKSGKCPIELWILSGKFGLIRAGHSIHWYDERMSAEQAKQMPPQLRSTLAKLGEQRYEEVFIDLGQDYLPAIAELPNYFPYTIINYGRGGIGERVSQVKAWIEQLNFQKRKAIAGFQTTGTRIVWHDLPTWWTGAGKFEKRLSLRQREFALLHVRMLLDTNLIELCEDPDLLQEISEFFDHRKSPRPLNSGFHVPPAGQRANHPIIQLRERLNNRAAQLRPSSPPERISLREMAGPPELCLLEAERDIRTLQYRIEMLSHREQVLRAQGDELQRQKVQTRLENQEALIEQRLDEAQQFALMHQIQINGQGKRWILTPRDRRYCNFVARPQVHVSEALQQRLEGEPEAPVLLNNWVYSYLPAHATPKQALEIYAKKRRSIDRMDYQPLPWPETELSGSLWRSLKDGSISMWERMIADRKVLLLGGRICVDHYVRVDHLRLETQVLWNDLEIRHLQATLTQRVSAGQQPGQLRSQFTAKLETLEKQLNWARERSRIMNLLMSTGGSLEEFKTRALACAAR